ncbi:hypothetical protein NT6N_29060 [Oceaniferula spumae]|uniref:Uncharacterized protein n=1 Tax=Oceaniferula spumae TaxID=2979115 RepID=A0AAT9FPF3_9BACT
MAIMDPMKNEVFGGGLTVGFWRKKNPLGVVTERVSQT